MDEISLNQDLKSIIQILEEWLKLIESSFTHELKSSYDFYRQKLSQIDCLNERIEKILLKYQSNDDNENNRQQQQQHFNSLLNCFQIFVQLQKNLTNEEEEQEGQEKDLSQADNTKNSSHKDDHSSGGEKQDNNGKLLSQQKKRLLFPNRIMTIRLLFIMVHTKSVVGLTNLLKMIIAKNSTSSEKKPLLSTKEELLLPKSVYHSFQLMFMNILAYYYGNNNSDSKIGKLFPSSFSSRQNSMNIIYLTMFKVEDDHDNDNENKRQQQLLESFYKELVIMKPIYLIYLELFLLLIEEESPPTEHEPNRVVKAEEMLIQINTLKNVFMAILLLMFYIYDGGGNNDKRLPIFRQDDNNNKWTMLFNNNDNNKGYLQQKEIDIINSMIIKKYADERFCRTHFHEKNRPFIIKCFLLLLPSVHENQQSQKQDQPVFERSLNQPFLDDLCSIIINMFRNHLIHSNGLRWLLDAALDSCQYSERDTTIQNRIESIVTIVVGLPVKYRNNYFREILIQIVDNILMIKSNSNGGAGGYYHSPEVYWRFGARILERLQQIKPDLVQKFVFDNIMIAFRDSNNEESKDIKDGIWLLQKIISVRACLKPMAQFFPYIFYVRFIFENKSFINFYPEKEDSEKLLLEMLKEIPRSVYLLDNCVCSEDFRNELVDHFQRKIFPFEMIIDEDDPIERTNRLATFTLNLVDKMSMDFRFSFFYLLLERLIDSNPSPVVCFLIPPFSDRLFGATISKREQDDRENFLISSRRTVQFLNSTMERIISKIMIYVKNPIDSDTDQNLAKLWIETLSICLQILAVLLEKLDNNSPLEISTIQIDNDSDADDDSAAINDRQTMLQELRPCHQALGILLSNSETFKLLNKIDEQMAHELYAKFEKIYEKQKLGNDNSFGKNFDSGPLEEALKELLNNDYFMPSRTHSLIVIKRLILTHHPSIDTNVDRILDQVKLILQDSESYVYMAAIRTLSSLAIRYTDKVLPVLLEELISQESIRPLADRLKIGEVLIQLAYSIGDFAYHYSNQLIHYLLIGVRSSEPAIRISCLSCLGEFCRHFPYGLHKHIIELITMAQQVMASDPELDVKRGVMLFLSLLLKGLDREGALLIQDQLRPIKSMILDVGNRTLDDVMQKHCSMAYQEISRIAELFFDFSLENV